MINERRAMKSELQDELDSIEMTASSWKKAVPGLEIALDGQRHAASAMLSRPGVNLDVIVAACRDNIDGERFTRASVASLRRFVEHGRRCSPMNAVLSCVHDRFYWPYLERQRTWVETLERDAAYKIPDIDYDELQLSAEDAEKLRAWQPRDVGEAKRNTWDQHEWPCAADAVSCGKHLNKYKGTRTCASACLCSCNMTRRPPRPLWLSQ